MQGASTGTPKKAEIARWDIMREIGCICCILKGVHGNPPQIHHIVEGKKRIKEGHLGTLALCPFHHEAIVPSGFTYGQMSDRVGPSYKKEPRRFKEEFGTQRELLEFQNELISHHTKVQQDEE